MDKFNGYRASKLAGGGLSNGYATPKAKQGWFIGATVNVGFVRDLIVIGKEGVEWTLEQASTGRLYVFEPHMGLSRAA